MPDATQPEQNEESLWDRVATSEEFRHLMSIKRIFIIPAFVFFLIYYF